MAVHDEHALWAYAAGELDAAAAEALRAHLEGCSDCRGRLGLVRQSRSALELAGGVAPKVEWRRVDDELGAVVARRMAKLERRGAWMWAVAGLAAAAVAALLFLRMPEPPSPEPSPVEPPVALAAPEPPAPARVETAAGATVAAAGASRALTGGDTLAAGDKVRTEKKGSAIVQLPEQSRMRISAASEVTLVSTTPKAISVKLSRGRVTTQASHAPGREFLVEADGLLVRVVGTAFTVGSSEREVEVVVGEGTVMVEPPRGESLLLRAGQRMRFERERWRARSSGLAASHRAEFSALGVSVEEPRMRPAASAAPPVAKLEPPPTPEVPPAPAPDEKTVEIDSPPLVNARKGDPDFPEDIEGLFLRRAEQALVSGGCGNYLLGLTEILESPERPDRRERARILRARCFDDRLMPLEAEREYQLYLEEFPNGRWALEARKVVGP